MAQLTYTQNPTRAFRGLLGDFNGAARRLSRANGAAAAQGFGIMVIRDATNPDTQFDIASATGQDPLGVLLHKHNKDNPDLAGVLGVDLLEVADVLRGGSVWVRVEEAVTPADDVFFRHTTGTGTEIGAFRTDADTATADQVTNARFLTSTAAAGVALLEINLP